jgi:CrcB protein
MKNVQGRFSVDLIKTIGYIGAGGALGAMARFGIKSIPAFAFAASFPLATLIINLLGTFLLTIFLNLSVSILDLNPKIRLAVATGFFGGFTTFSTMCKDEITLLLGGNYLIFCFYMALSVILGLAMVFLGMIAAREIISHRHRRIKRKRGEQC